MGKIIPAFIQSAVWSVPVGQLDLHKDKVYIIHQVLAFGTLEQIKWLFSVFSRHEIRRVFFNEPQKVYSPVGYAFVKNMLLSGDKLPPKPSRYVSSITGQYPRPIPKSHFQKIEAISA